MLEQLLRRIKFLIPVLFACVGLGIHIVFWIYIAVGCINDPASCHEAGYGIRIVDFAGHFLVVNLFDVSSFRDVYHVYTYFFVFGALQWIITGWIVGLVANRAVVRWATARFAQYLR